LKKRKGELWAASAHFRAEISLSARRTARLQVRSNTNLDTKPDAVITKKMHPQTCDDALFLLSRTAVSKHVKSCHAARGGVMGISGIFVVSR